MCDFSISVDKLKASLRPDERDQWRHFFNDCAGIEGEEIALSTVLQRRGIQDALHICRQFLDKDSRWDLCVHLLGRIAGQPMVARVSGLIEQHLTGECDDHFFGGQLSEIRSAVRVPQEGMSDELRRGIAGAVDSDPAAVGHAVARLLAGPKDWNGSRLLPSAWTGVIADLLAWISAPPRVFKRWTPPPAPPTGPSSAQVSAVQMEIRRRKLEAMTIEELQALLADNAALARI